MHAGSATAVRHSRAVPNAVGRVSSSPSTGSEASRKSNRVGLAMVAGAESTSDGTRSGAIAAHSMATRAPSELPTSDAAPSPIASMNPSVNRARVATS
ncbi:hypothetical protein D9M69_618840 [compost metagenome]